MKILYRNILLLLSALYVIAFFVSNYIINVGILPQILWFPLLLLLPGFLSLLVLKIKFNHTLLYIINSLGISIGIIYILGLFSTGFLPMIGFARPLDSNSYLPIHILIILLLLIILLIKNWTQKVLVSEILYHVKRLVIYVVIIIISLISVIGAVLLNNGGSNYISLSWFYIISFLLFITSCLPVKKFIAARPYVLFLFSLSILWLLSSRSSFFIGWDVIQESLAAKNIQLSGTWNYLNIKDAYYACLSITILPAILSNITSIQIDTLYKFLYPFIFSHFSVIIYFFLRKTINENLSFLSLFYLVAQPFFIQPMVALARQEIAFIFLGLLLLSIFSIEISSKSRKLLIYLYTFSLITSHYSTTYISVLIITLVYLVIIILNFLKLITFPKIISKLSIYKNWITNYKSNINGSMVLLLILGTFIWYFQLTRTSGNISSLVSESINNMSSLFTNEQQSQETQRAIPNSTLNLFTTEDDINGLLATTKTENLTVDQISTIFTTYKLLPLYETIIPSIINYKYSNMINSGITILKNILKYILIIGSVLLILKTFFNSKNVNIDFTIFTIINTFILLIMIFHPTLGLKYNISRIYLQLLIFLSMSLIYGLNLLLWKIPENIKLIIISIIIFPLLLSFHGGLTPILGGIPVVHFYNKGTDYEKFYFFNSEIEAAKWLQDNRNYKNTVYGDNLAGLRILKANSFFTNPTILPITFANDAQSYVYLSSTNKKLGKAQVSYNGKFITYTYPTEFLNEYRNLIYSNENSNIYR